VLACEVTVLDHEVVSLRAKLVVANARRAEAEAKLRGLAAVVAKR